MESIDREPVKQENTKPETGTEKGGTRIAEHNNEINTGSVGFEGNGDNGAAELRYLRKKHGITSSDKK